MKKNIIGACPMKFASRASKYLIWVISVLIGVIGVNNRCSAQDLFYVKANITVTPSSSIYIKGGIFADDSASINNDGTITIANHTTPGNENWTNNTSDTMLTGSGTVIFSSSEQQNISGNYTTTYSILDINNSSAAGVVLDTNTFVNDTLKLNDGVDRKSTRLNSSHIPLSRMPSSA